LEGLVRAWKSASWAAAEEVFEGVKARVEGMGGVKAWKEMERGKGRDKGWGWGWEREGEKGGKGGDGDEDGEGVGEGEIEDEDDEMRLRKDGKGEEEEEEEEEVRFFFFFGLEIKGWSNTRGPFLQEFTMAMMLQSLSIDLDVIGYDKEGQRWVD
jgi:hypothetical protein